MSVPRLIVCIAMLPQSVCMECSASQPASDAACPAEDTFHLDLLVHLLLITPATTPDTALAATFSRSLDWCCQIELLLLVGAPQQAFERLASVFYSAIEGFEKNVLGWDIPGDDDTIPMYENLALYYPEEHAYTFDSYRCVGSPP